MIVKLIKFEGTGSGIVVMFMLCLVSLVLVACDSSKTDERVDSTLEPGQLVPAKQTDADATSQTADTESSTQANIAIAPGNIVVLALSTYDARAVVKSAQGEMQAMKPGDVVEGTETVLVDILDDRLVFEELVTKPSGLKVKETVWVYKAKNGVSRVQVLNLHSPELKGRTVKKTIIVSE
jgi:ribosomal protein L19